MELHEFFWLLLIVSFSARILSEAAARLGIPSVISQLAIDLILEPSLLKRLKRRIAGYRKTDERVDYNTENNLNLNSPINVLVLIRHFGITLCNRSKALEGENTQRRRADKSFQGSVRPYWRIAMDTGLETLQTWFATGEESLLDPSQIYHAGPRSSVILVV